MSWDWEYHMTQCPIPIVYERAMHFESDKMLVTFIWLFYGVTPPPPPYPFFFFVFIFFFLKNYSFFFFILF
jgi:hypothetical protein